MGLEVKGLDELLRSLDNLTKIERNNISKTAVKKASEVMLEELKEEAPKAKKDSKNSYLHLKNTLTSKDGGVQAKMGIDGSNFSQCRGLLFHYFGFRSHPPDDWVDRAFDRSKDKATEVVKEELAKAIK